MSGQNNSKAPRRVKLSLSGQESPSGDPAPLSVAGYAKHPSLGDLPDPGIEAASPAWAGGFFTV